MPAWGEYVDQLSKINPNLWDSFLETEVDNNLDKISTILGSPNVILYASAFLQKPNLEDVFLTHEDINGFMNAIYQMKQNESLALIMHTPGGDIHAAETIVDYIHQKFKKIVTIVPVYAFSAGTIISLSSDEVYLGRQSQLGPTDPQIYHPPWQKHVSALSILQQFKRAKEEIMKNPASAVVWYPVLQTLGHGITEEAHRAIEYSKVLIRKWVGQRKKSSHFQPDVEEIVKFFCEEQESHGKRINKEELRRLGLNVKDLEDNQDLQEAVLSLYHLITIMFERGPSVKVIMSNTKRKWIKSIQMIPPIPQVRGPAP